MPAKLLVIGIDAAEATLLERWAEEGHLPTVSRLLAEGARRELSNSMNTLPGAIWPEITTGRSGGKLGHFYHPRQIHTGEADFRPLAADDIDPRQYFWNVASDAGCRVAVVDVPQVIPYDRMNGVQLLEWGCHDRNFETATHPHGLINEIRSQYGNHPVDSCDRFHENTIEGYVRLRDALIEGAQKKTAISLDLLARRKWDLFTSVYCESHCVGHQFWTFHAASYIADKAHNVPEALHHTIFDVYREIDRGMGQLIEAAGPDAGVLVVVSHGMGPKIGGPQLLPTFLKKMGLYRPKKRSARVQLRRLIPKPIRSLVQSFLPGSTEERLESVFGRRPLEMDTPGNRALAVPNNRCGAIRLNLAGREPNGTVQRGAEADALIEEIRRELLSLKDPSSGESIIREVKTATEAFGAEHHPDVPDILVVFRRDLGSLSACESSRVGRIAAPALPEHPPRTGDHTLESRLWALGDQFWHNIDLAPANVLDIAPTVLHLLGVEVPAWTDGHALTDLKV